MFHCQKVHKRNKVCVSHCVRSSPKLYLIWKNVFLVPPVCWHQIKPIAFFSHPPLQNNIVVYQPGTHVYDRCLLYISNISERNDVFVNFMKEGRGKIFSWPSDNNKRKNCYRRTRNKTQKTIYKLINDDFQKVNALFLQI